MAVCYPICDVCGREDWNIVGLTHENVIIKALFQGWEQRPEMGKEWIICPECQQKEIREKKGEI